MTRRESLLVLGIAYALMISGLTWLFGPYGLIIGGLAVCATTLFAFERVSEARGEALEDAVPR